MGRFARLGLLLAPDLRAVLAHVDAALDALDEEGEAASLTDRLVDRSTAIAELRAARQLLSGRG